MACLPGCRSGGAVHVKCHVSPATSFIPAQERPIHERYANALSYHLGLNFKEHDVVRTFLHEMVEEIQAVAHVAMPGEEKAEVWGICSLDDPGLKSAIDRANKELAEEAAARSIQTMFGPMTVTTAKGLGFNVNTEGLHAMKCQQCGTNPARCDKPLMSDEKTCFSCGRELVRA